MPPRKSTSRAQPSAASTASAQPVASSSKVTLDEIPTLQVPESITHEYTQSTDRVVVELSPEDKEQLVKELVNFQPRKLFDDITEHARNQPYVIVESIYNWARVTAEKHGAEYEREVENGSYALETLLAERVDSVLDKFVAYALRNAFNPPDGLEMVLPWHRGLDFERGAHVASLPRGEDTLVDRLEDLRTKVEQARLLSAKLQDAEDTLDRRLEVALQRKAEVGFVHDVLDSAGLSPLPEKAESLYTALSALHAKLSPLEPAQPGLSQTAVTASESSVRPGVKAWELGRQAYLNWAVGKMLHPSSEGEAGAVGGGVGGVGTGAEGPMEVAERQVAETGSTQDLEAATKYLA